MRLIDGDLAVAKCNEDIEAVKDISQRVDGILDAVMNIHECPTVDAVPRQKYEEDMENASAHGYTDSESNFRKMIADGELVEVVRCKDCTRYEKKRGCNLVNGLEIATENCFCSYGERRTDEETIHQYHERHKEVLKEMSMPVGRNVMDALRERRTDETD